jgi:hypothetical protein
MFGGQQTLCAAEGEIRTRGARDLEGLDPNYNGQTFEIWQ